MPGRLNTLSVTTTPKISSAEASADLGDHRHRGVPRRVPHHHGDLVDALGARSADVIFTQHVEHRRPRHARDQRDIDEGEGAGRQDDALEERPKAVQDAA